MKHALIGTIMLFASITYSTAQVDSSATPASISAISSAPESTPSPRQSLKAPQTVAEAQLAAEKYLGALDDALKPDLAASLAGLALAAAAFLVPFTTKSALTADDGRADHAALAVRFLVAAFYSFIVVVISDLLLDPAVFLGKEWIDGTANLAAGAWGVRCLFCGANSIRHVLGPKPKKIA